MEYSVDATSKSGDNFTGQILEAEDFEQLKTYVQETFAWMNGCHDTSDVDCSYIKFDYDYVEDEDGNDVTKEAREWL